MAEPKSCRIMAPSKINLHLRIKEKRSDGFHELESIFAALAFGDSLRFEVNGKAGSWELLVNQTGTSAGQKAMEPKVPGSLLGKDFFGEKNLVSRAAVLFRARTGYDRGLRCSLEKRIPLEAGLGGGSSDAASTLLALNLLAGTQLSREELLEMAVVLGSDVPFFIFGGTAWVSGRGEHIEPLPPAGDLEVLLIKPPFKSRTPEAFRLLDAARESAPPPGLGSWQGAIPQGTAGELKSAWAGPPQEWPFFNDFLALLPEADVYQDIIERLGKEGALFSGLSGSGSCCFGVFADSNKAAAAAINFQRNQQNSTQYFILSTFFLASKAIPVVE